jgi:predicted alpha/beta superfamily hydrolase
MNNKWLVVLSLIFLLQNTRTNAQTPYSIGVVDSVYSKELNEWRTLNIYLPNEYSADSAANFSVVYLLDGSADEDFLHISGLVSFYNFPWLDVMKPTIVVGVANVDRKRDFCFPTSIAQDKIDFPTAGGSVAFRNFLEKELVPFIEKKYSNNPDRMLIGQSLGGLLACEVLAKQPQLFSKYLIVSPSLWWDNESLLLPLNASSIPYSTKVYIAVGKDEPTIMKKDAKKLASLLKKKNISTQIEILADEDHAGVLHTAAQRGFRMLGK